MIYNNNNIQQNQDPLSSNQYSSDNAPYAPDNETYNFPNNDPYDFEKMYKAERKSNLRRCFSKIGLSLLLALAVMYVIVFIFTSISISSSINNIGLLNTITQIASSISSVISFILAGFFCCFLFRVSAGSLISFKMKPEIKPSLVYIISASFALFMVSNYMTDAFLRNMEFVGWPIAQTSMGYEKNLTNLIIYPLSIAVIPALTEEFLFRGVVMGLLRKFGDSFAIITSSLFFGLMHQNFIQFPFAFVGGLVFGYITIYTGSIVPAIAVHFANNFFSCIFTILPYYIDSSVSEILCAVVIIAASVFGLYSICKLSRTDKNLLRLNNHTENEYSDLLTSESVKYKYFFQSYGTIAFVVLLLCLSIGTSILLF